MRQRHRARLDMEALEDRCVPATVQFIDGNLFVSNPTIAGGVTALTLTGRGTNTFQVNDFFASDGTYSGVTNVFMFGSNAADLLTFNLNGNTYSGNLFIASGNGNDTVNVTAVLGGTIAGNVTVLTGHGNSLVAVHNLIPNTGNALDVFEGSVQATAESGNDTFAVGSVAAPTMVLGNITATGFQTANIGGLAGDVYSGNVTVNDGLINSGVSLTTATGITIGGNLDLNTGGGSGADTVTLASGTVNGSILLNLGNGNNTFSNTGALTVAGNFALQNGSGSDTVAAIDAGTVFQGNAQFTFGDGNNSFQPTTAFTVQGNLNLSAGNGSTLVTNLAAAVNGKLSLQFGNGADTVTASSSIGGLTSWYSGNGADSFALGSGANNYNIAVQFGNGADTFTLATSGLVTGSVVAGTSGGNVFNQGMAVLGSPFILSNFP